MTETTARILAVDDEENIREMLQRGLERAGYEVVTAQSSDQAAELLEREKFDLVLQDITMPGKSGMDFLPEIISQDPELSVIMLTGIADVSTGVRAMRVGAYDYVNKPVSLADLVVRIEHALSKRALLIENRAYQQKLERMVDELNARQEERNRELNALNKLFESHVGQTSSAQEAYRRLRDSLASFTAELEDLATIAGIPRQEKREAPVQYKTKRVKVRTVGQVDQAVNEEPSALPR